jgi:putative transcriptional regulator
MKTRISEFRKELKMTQEELAEKVEVTRQTIISLEQGDIIRRWNWHIESLNL